MADFKTPNLCGASEALNNASSKIENLINEIDLKIDSVASEAAAAFNNKLNEVKAGLDGLAIDIPKLPAVNFQSEITNLINNVDKTTAQGFAEFTSKLAEIEKDFGDVLTEKGLSIDKLITDATTKLGGGGNLCDLVPNLEIPAGNSGTGVTTEEKEERGSGTSITISETPKEIISLQGKRAGTSFFGNVTYKQSGKTLTTTQIDNDNNLVSYTELKVKYIISLIKEKPIAAKQAAAPAETEEVSIVIRNLSVETKKTELKSKVEAVKSGNSFTSTTKSTPIFTPTGKTIKATTSKDAVTTNENGEKVRSTKSADGIAGKYKSVLEVFWSASEFDRYKSGLADKFKKGKGPSLISLDGNSDWEFYILPLKHEPVEIKKIMWAQWTLKSAGSGIGSGDGLVAKMEKTNPLNPNNLAIVNSPSVLKGKTLDFGPNAGSTNLKLPIGKPLYIAVRYNILDTTDSNYISADIGTSRTVEITEEFYTSSLPSSVDIDIEGFKLIEKGNDLNLKHIPTSIVEINAREYLSNGKDYNQFIFQEGQLKGSGVNNIIPALVPPKNLSLIPKSTEGGNPNNINIVIIVYNYLEKIDPSVKG